MTKILIGADLVPTKNNLDLFIRGSHQELLGRELAGIVEGADYRIFNLETPLTDRETPISKKGPNLMAPVKSAEAFRSMGINLFSLANNHIMDQGEPGLHSTMETLETMGISHVGAGKNLEEAKKPFYFNAGNMVCGVYACAEHEFSIAGEDSPGANPFDPLESPDHISEMKQRCDYLIVLYHGGKEQYRYPSPLLQKKCRKMAEKGADLVVCQHSHCIGCKEEYRGATIVYGQGNFLFAKNDNEFWNSGLLIQLQIDENVQIQYIPIRRNGYAVGAMDEQEGTEVLQGFFSRSEEIRKNGFIEDKYTEFAVENCPGYILYFLGLSDRFLYRLFNKLSGQKLRKRITMKALKKRRLGMQNYIECEAHRELLLKGMKAYDDR